MKGLLFIILFYVLSSPMFAQQIQKNTASLLPDYINEQTHSGHINSVNGQRYVRTLLKASSYDYNFMRYSLNSYDSLICDDNGLITTYFSNPANEPEGMKSSYKYDDEGRKIEAFTQIKQNKIWTNFTRYKYEYDASGNLTLQSYEVYADTVWSERARIARTYDAAGRILEILASSRLDDSSSLEDYSRSLYEYNGHGDLINWSEDFMNDGVWKKTYNTIWTYDENYYLTEELSQSFWNGSSWSMIRKSFYTRNEQGQLLTGVLFGTTKNSYLEKIDSIKYSYNNEGRLAEKYYEYFRDPEITIEKYSYNESGLISSTQINAWYNTLEKTPRRFLYSYNDDGSLSVKIFEIWVDSLSSWTLESKLEYTYDGNGNCVKILKLDLENGGWVPSRADEKVKIPGTDQEYYCGLIEMSYTLVNPIATAADGGFTPDKFALAQNYPNPFNPETKISFSLPQSGKASLKIYDMLGREIAELVNGNMEKGPYTVNFSGRNLSSGVYIYRLQSGNFTESKKMLLIK